MFHKLVHKRCFAALLTRLRPSLGRRGAVALIIALTAPLLIAATGLAVDVGYWYQQQDTLQSATDAAALAAATTNAATTINQTTSYSVTDSTTAEPYAVTAANNASNSQFGLTPSTLTLTYTPGILSNGTTISTWQASATIPRASFFSRVKGMGLAGLLPGTQSASASAVVKTVTTTTGGSCLLSLGTAGQSTIGNLTSNGNNLVDAFGCNITADSNACNGNKSAISAIGGATIQTTATTVNSLTGASIFTAGCTYHDSQSNILAANGTASNNYNIVTGAPVESDPLYYMGDVPTFWYDISSNLTSIPPCVEYLVSGSGNSASVLISPPFQDNGNDTLRYTYCLFDSSSKTYTIPTQGTVTFSNNVSYFFNNGFSTGSQTTVTFGTGIYYFDGTANNNKDGLNVNGGSVITALGTTFVFAGSTSYSLGGSSTALNMSAPSTNCVAPQNYNAPAEAQNNYTASLYNMTSIENGQGICGILIYQARNDVLGGTINGGVASTVNGIIYTPKAGFTSTGNATISSTTDSSGTPTGTFAVLSDNFKVSGTGKLEVSIGAGSSSDLAASLVQQKSSTTSAALLVN
ncbi:TadE/TadG family type IV pilus assembly protein [Acidocella aquatica]|nr:pilus assembly protein TadG-related protein [Acidocella aquatica]